MLPLAKTPKGVDGRDDSWSVVSGPCFSTHSFPLLLVGPRLPGHGEFGRGLVIGSA